MAQPSPLSGAFHRQQVLAATEPLRLFDPEAAHRLGRPASNLHSTMRIGDPAKGSNPAGTPMEMLAAPIGLFAPLRIGRTDLGDAGSA
jgi:hypothetical protein